MSSLLLCSLPFSSLLIQVLSSFISSFSSLLLFLSAQLCDLFLHSFSSHSVITFMVEEAPSPANKLPSELLSKIFEYCDPSDLGYFSLVDHFWKSATFLTWPRHSSLKATGQLMRRGLGAIVQGYCRSSLKKLELRGLGKSDDMIAASTFCFSSLSALEELIINPPSDSDSLTWLCDESSAAPHPSFTLVLSHLTSLRSLSLRSCHITSKGIILSLRSFRHLLICAPWI